MKPDFILQLFVLTFQELSLLNFSDFNERVCAQLLSFESGGRIQAFTKHNTTVFRVL